MTRENYFDAYTGYFWQWEDGDEVLAVPGGTTIAYRQYVLELLDLLSGQGLPPLGSLLLVLIATNGDSAASLDRADRLVRALLKDVEQDVALLDDAMVFLRRLSTISSKLKKGRKRFLLLQTLFANGHNRLSAEDSKETIRDFRAKHDRAETPTTWINFNINIFHREFTVLRLLSAKYPNNDMLTGQMTAIPELPEPLEEDKPRATETERGLPKDFIDTLVADSRTFYVGSLVRRLWSGLNIPHHNSLPSQQPLGGVSDLSNKGEFHRLLLSEFAHDDLFFLSRLANNEALYLNREVPPQAGNLVRVVLIDVSIKNWGTPRLIAYALLLAIAKHPKTDIPCMAFAVGDEVYPLKYETVDELIESLERLEPCLHPVTGLQKFFRERGGLKNREVFLIASDDTFRLPAMHKLLSDRPADFDYCIYTSASGDVDLYKRQQSGRKQVQHLQLPLGELWRNETTSPPRALVSDGLKLPDYPILFPPVYNSRALMISGKGDVYLMSNNRTLQMQVLGHRNRKLGTQMILERLSSFSEAELGVLEDGSLQLLLFRLSDRMLTITDVTRRYSASIAFLEWINTTGWRFLFCGDHFVYMNPAQPLCCWTFKLEQEIVMTQLNHLPPAYIEFFNEDKGRRQMPLRLAMSEQILKNINRIFINESGALVLNIHELQVNGETVRLKRTTDEKVKKDSAVVYSNGFRFANGSTIETNRAGMLILKSAQLPHPVHIPTVMDNQLALATEEDFAGNDFYRMPDKRGQNVLTVKEFWKKYIEPFIQEICAYEAGT